MASYYTASGVIALERLLPAMLSRIDLPRALLRGRYMAAVARMERRGVPIDVELLDDLNARWDSLKLDLIAEIDTDYGVYDATTFKTRNFEAYLVRNNIRWPLLDSGKPKLDEDTFKEMSRLYPEKGITVCAPVHDALLVESPGTPCFSSTCNRLLLRWPMRRSRFLGTNAGLHRRYKRRRHRPVSVTASLIAPTTTTAVDAPPRRQILGVAVLMPILADRPRGDQIRSSSSSDRSLAGL